MKILKKICFVVLMAIFLSSCSTTPSTYTGDCFTDKDAADCRVKAEQGVAQAQFSLGEIYYNGRGVIQDHKEAGKWFRLAAEQGYASAQENLGWMYYNGRGVIQDDKEAVKWYRKSAEQGYSSAQSNLGLMYEYGEGVLQDYVMAHMYFNIASVNGDKYAIKNRGIVEKKMTPSQIEESQKLTREWMRTH